MENKPLWLFFFLLELSFLFCFSTCVSTVQGCGVLRRCEQRVSRVSQVTVPWGTQRPTPRGVTRRSQSRNPFCICPQIEPCIEGPSRARLQGKNLRLGIGKPTNLTIKSLLLNTFFKDTICPSEYSLAYIALTWHLFYKNWRF